MNRIIGIACVLLMSACSSGGDIEDTWMNEAMKLRITDDGDLYKVEVLDQDGRVVSTHMANYEKQMLTSSDFPEISYSERSDALTLQGRQLLRAKDWMEELKERDRIKNNFEGAWIVEEEPAEYATVVEISLLNGRCRLRETSSITQAGGYVKFRNEDFHADSITAIREYAVDSRHEHRVRYRLVDENTVEYWQEHSWDDGHTVQRMVRHMINDPFTGTWSSTDENSHHTVSITRGFDSYTVTPITDKGEVGGPVDCRRIGNQLVWPGDRRDYYKMQVPVYRLSGERSLEYESGAELITLVREG